MRLAVSPLKTEDKGSGAASRRERSGPLHPFAATPLRRYAGSGKLRVEWNAPRLPLLETPDSARLRAAASDKAMRQKNHSVMPTIEASEEHERRQVPESPSRTPRCK